MHKWTSFHRLFLCQFCASARALSLYIVRRAQRWRLAATTSYVGVKPLMCRRTSFILHWAISHHAQVHELFILAMTAKNVDDKALVRQPLSGESNRIPKHYHWSSHRDLHWISITHSLMKNYDQSLLNNEEDHFLATTTHSAQGTLCGLLWSPPSQVHYEKWRGIKWNGFISTILPTEMALAWKCQPEVFISSKR